MTFWQGHGFGIHSLVSLHPDEQSFLVTGVDSFSSSLPMVDRLDLRETSGLLGRFCKIVKSVPYAGHSPVSRTYPKNITSTRYIGQQIELSLIVKTPMSKCSYPLVLFTHSLSLLCLSLSLVLSLPYPSIQPASQPTLYLPACLPACLTAWIHT